MRKLNGPEDCTAHKITGLGGALRAFFMPYRHHNWLCPNAKTMKSVAECTIHMNRATDVRIENLVKLELLVCTLYFAPVLRAWSLLSQKLYWKYLKSGVLCSLPVEQNYHSKISIAVPGINLASAWFSDTKAVENSQCYIWRELSQFSL